ncbi:MAG: hypothetical protein WKG00_05130 [Polyangiaceae bacterium]
MATPSKEASTPDEVALLAADLASGAARLAILDGIGSDASADHRELVGLLRAEAVLEGPEGTADPCDAQVPRASARQLLESPAAALAGMRWIAIQRALLEQLAARPKLAGGCLRLRGRLALAAAAFESIAAEHEQARRWALVASEDLGGDTSEREEAALLRTAAELRAGDLTRARAALATLGVAGEPARPYHALLDLHEHRDFGSFHGKHGADPGNPRWMSIMPGKLEEMADGDGAALAREWPPEALELLALGTTVRTGKRALADHLRSGAYSRYGLAAAGTLEIAAERQGEPRVLGDVRGAAREHRRLALDRAYGVPLALVGGP